MATYFLSSDADVAAINVIEQKIRSFVPELVRLKRLDDVVQIGSERSHERTYVLVVGSPKDSGFFGRLIEFATRYRERIYFILISDDIPASDYKRLVRTGGGDWVSAAAVPQEVLDIMSRPRARGDARVPKSGDKAGEKSSGPVVVCFVPSGGGVGNTTITAEIAVQLKSGKPTRERSVCIIDLDFQSSHVCDHLDIEPQLQIQEISNSPERLDHQLFEIFISRHGSGVDVFAAPRTKLDVCDVSVESLDNLFDMIMARYDLVLIDMPASWFKWSFQVVSASDAVVVTGINTIPGLRRMAETVTAVRDMRRASTQLAMAVNRCERGLFGGLGKRHQVEKVLGREQVFFIGEDPMIAQAANAGTPLASSDPRSKTSKEIAALAAFCAALKSTRTIVK
jgi:pilus assembly protein CpaE